ncbi:aspartyl-phosphate phosphatase Spo0E family protein [Clostridium algoriphilum]|uniref:aspartyl-phosphate phosphatase Spo0E family protein n=1 Tax=Clostridium algoriphilum TaxID=198347 RepID=UPI001CF2582A|nr:aspartyl-phosphate phosphatase Spo0E family protein [Clostridium algoriphilum]MCB2292730.1 aspartyl-phosphate phosphatase Spo0E family protein [Clostridium algoriphilum]
MNIKLKIIKIQLELLRSILHFLLNFKKPSDKIVILCSQQLDEVIVLYHKVIYASDKVASTHNRALSGNTLSPFLKTLDS